MMTTDQNVENWDIQTLLGGGGGDVQWDSHFQKTDYLLKKVVVINSFPPLGF